MGQTTAEKIISAHTGRTVYAGEVVIVRVDGVMATDATAPFALQAFREMGGVQPWDAKRVSLVLDHAAPAPNERVANLHKMMREFAAATGCNFYDVGAGICHQLMVENGHVRPGDLFLGADSHTPHSGALNALALGVGSTDLAATMLTGKTWLKVPKTIKISLRGKLNPGVYAKDLALHILSVIGVSGGSYRALEFMGETVAALSLSGRAVLSNMASEMGAKAALVDPTGLQLPYDWTPTYPDPDAEYEAIHVIDVSNLTPLVAAPDSPENVVPVGSMRGVRIQQAFIGSCTNSRLDDLHAAAAILRGKKIANGVRLLIAPASAQVFRVALNDGTVAALMDAGAAFITSGCGPCVGTHLGVPGDGETIISSTNRNFKGRMGNPNAAIYLSSPAVVAASALRGVITDPNEVV